jgi:hypothetical protein
MVAVDGAQLAPLSQRTSAVQFDFGQAGAQVSGVTGTVCPDG